MTRHVNERRDAFGVEPICAAVGVPVSTYYARRSRKPSRRELADYDGQIATGWNVLKSSTDTSLYPGTHGTYVAGVVGLALNNGTGNAGYCPGCRIMPVQVGTDSGAYMSFVSPSLSGTD